MKFSGLTEQQPTALRRGGPDAFGNPAETVVSGGSGSPCRRCLKQVPKGEPYLNLAHKPFTTTQPYSEIGPIFLCKSCKSDPDGSSPQVLTTSPDYFLKAYSSDERIVYGTGAFTPASNVSSYAASLLAREDVAFVDARSSKNNCWLACITRQ